MLRAIIFDFNGIILNDEPLHFQSMQQTVAALGIHITEEEYWAQYLPLDDFRCLEAICRNHGVTLTDAQRDRALSNKPQLYQMLLEGRYPIFPGAVDFVRDCARHYPLAIASGARRNEIQRALKAVGLEKCFQVIVGAEDSTQGKPHPESYLLALDRINAHANGSSTPIRPEECLVIEDSIGGVQGSRAAGMICLAVSNSYPADRLNEAHRVVRSLAGLSVESLHDLFPE